MNNGERWWVVSIYCLGETEKLPYFRQICLLESLSLIETKQLPPKNLLNNQNE